MSNMVVNTNVLALNSHRSMKGVGNMQAKASARLSSGLKINSAADDAAGLAISEKMRAQIRGLDMASKNSQDAISLIQTAEGGMQEIDNMIQRIRELTVQVSNDTNENNKLGTGDRQKIQDEIDQLTKEIDSMAERVEFNKKKVINGDYSGASSDVAKAKIAARDAQAAFDAATQQVAKDKNAVKLATDSTNTARTIYNNFNLAGGAMSRAVDAFGGDVFVAQAIGATDTSATETALAKSTSAPVAGSAYADLLALQQAVLAAAALGAAGGATITRATGTTEADIAAQAEYDAFMTATGIGTPGSATVADTVFQALYGDGSITHTTVTHIDGFDPIGATSVFASATARETLEKIAAYDYSNIEDATLKADIKANVDLAKATIDALDVVTASKAEGGAFNNAEKIYKVYTDSRTQLMANFNTAGATQVAAKAALDINNAKLDGAKLTLSAAQAQLVAAEAASAADGRYNGLYFQVGANANQGLQMEIGSVKTDMLGIGDGEGKSVLDVVKDTGADITGLLDVLDTALSYVTTERSKLGAAQNRLEYTIKSLDISSENLSASESRVRDTDMAKEMMNLTRANVLQQAAVSMLAQANQAPQSVLQLLR